MIEYSVWLADLNRHHFEIQCHVRDPDREQRFTMPSWIPGSYLLREYARHIVSIRAEENGQVVEIKKVSKSTWSCRNAGPLLTVTIEVFALDRSVRGAYLDGRRGFFNGTCLFLSPEGREEEPVQVRLERPVDLRCKHWRVATAMASKTIDDAGFGTYSASSYDELIDHPIEISDFTDTQFEAAGVPHRLVMAGRHQADLPRIAKDLTQLCQAHIDFFGGAPPFHGYCFLGLAVGEGYGGLEHRSSSSLIFCRDYLPKIGEISVSRDYQRFLSLCSHEYFHTWNVKRIKPQAFTPYRLDRRNHTRLMWVFEGITSYYQDLMLLRSHLIEPEAYLEGLGRLLTRVYRTPGRFRQSIAEASFDAWDKLYKPEANSSNATVSYYSKGALVALALDLTIRKESSTNLDRVMGELWKRFGKEGIGIGENEFEILSQEITGIDLVDFFELGVRGKKDLPLEELMSEFGVILEFHKAGSVDTSGLSRGEPEPAVDLGVQYRSHPQGLELTSIVDDGPGEHAALNSGDVLIAIDGFQVNGRSLAKRLARFEVGDTVSVTVFRDDELLEFQIMLAEVAKDNCVLSFDEEASVTALQRRKAWLGS